jgi:hypothetical protein
MSNQLIQESEIEDFVIPTVRQTDALGVPIEPKEEVVTTTIAENLEGLSDQDSSLKDKKETQDDSKQTEEEEAAIVEEQRSVEEQDNTAPNPQSEFYRNTLKELYGEDLSIVQEIDGEEVETNLNEIDIDHETFANIIRSKTEQEKEEALKDKVSLEGTSEFMRKLVDIDKRGGSISELLQAKEAYLDPLEGFDMDTVEGQRGALLLYYQAQGQTQEDAARFVRAFEVDGLLEEKASEAESKIRAAVQAQAEQAEKVAIQAEEKRKEDLKQFKKTLKESLTTEYGFNEKMITRLVDSATKVDESTKTAGIVQNYRKYMADPTLAPKLILFLNDIEEYDKQVSKVKITESKIKEAQKIKIMKTNTSNVEVRRQQKSDEDNAIEVTVSNR